MAALFFGSDALTFGGRALLFGSTAITTTLPTQGGWGTYDTREDERRQARVAQEERQNAAKRRKAVEQAFKALDVRPDLVPEALAPMVKAEIRAVAVPKVSLAVFDALDRAEALVSDLIEQMWAEQRAMAEQAAMALRRRQEEEALIALLMVA